MSLLYTQSINELLDSISEKFASPETLTDPATLQNLLVTIDQFQQDPEVLDKYISKWVPILTSMPITDSTLKSNAKIFYTLSKICSWKSTFKYLDSNIYRVPELLSILKKNTNNNNNWEVNYFVLSWISLLVMSPFQLPIDSEIYTIIKDFKTSDTLKIIISHIHAELLIKNPNICLTEINSIDFQTWNFLLKILVQKPNDYQINFIQTHNDAIVNLFEGSLETTTSHSNILALKILTKLFKLLLVSGWDNLSESLESIIDYFLKNMDSSLNDYRFQLGHSLSKILNIIYSELEDPDMVNDIINFIINDTIDILNKPWDIVDIGRLHSLLLTIAEASDIITNDISLINKVVTDIIPKTSYFQQKSMNQIRGSQIRDASNFICWKLIRIQRKEMLDIKIVKIIFLNILMCSLTDYDLIIRKSSNAALQEILGRFGSLFLENSVLMKIIQLDINYSENSLKSNILTIFQLFKDTPDFLNFIIDWLIDYSILKNNSLQLVNQIIDVIEILFEEVPDDILAKNYMVSKIFGATLQYSRLSPSINSAKSIIILIQLSKFLDTNEKFHEILKFASEELLKPKVIKKSNSNIELFKQLAILKYWEYQLLHFSKSNFKIDLNTVTLLTMVLRNIPLQCQYGNQFKSTFVSIIKVLGNSDNTSYFSSKDICQKFWNTFESYVKFNNPLSCYLTPYLNLQLFESIFYKYLPILDSDCKTEILKALGNQNEKDKIGNPKIINTVVKKFLNDYTITDQGDVGRFVRTESIKLINMNQDLFLNSSDKEEMINNLLRITGEPATELRELSYQTLCDFYKWDNNNDNFNSKILKFHINFFNGNNLNFWKGYILSGGAIHSTDIAISNSINSFLKYYDDDEINDDNSRLEICNNLIRVIPRANDIVKWKNEKSEGIDEIKFVVTSINFWIRLFESNIKINKEFNYKGVYAKFYNIELINSKALKTACVRIFPYIVISMYRGSKEEEQEEENKKFYKSVITRLWDLGIRYKKSKRLDDIAMSDLCVESIIQILISTENVEIVEKMMNNGLDKFFIKYKKEELIEW